MPKLHEIIKKAVLISQYLFFIIKGDKIIYVVKKQNLTYLSFAALRDLKETIKSLEKKKIKGILIEAGCALGGSAIVISSYKREKRPLFVYDVFGMIPPPSLKDGTDVHERYNVISSGQSIGLGGGTYYGYIDNLKRTVEKNFNTCNLELERNTITLVEGLFQHTLRIKEEVAFAHIDSDWYESVMTCLKEIEPYLVLYGVLVIDDYYDWSGCRVAVDEYFKDKKDKYLFLKKTKLHLIRMK